MNHETAILFLLLISITGCLGQPVELANWPGGKQAAVIISFDVEQASLSDLQKTDQMLSKDNIPATFYVVAGYYQGSGETLEALTSYEVASKGWNQSTWPHTSKDRKNSIINADEWLRSKGFTPKGFRAPFLEGYEDASQVAEGLGYRYESSKTGLLPETKGNIVELPLSVAYDPFWNNPVEEYLPLFYYAFEETYDEGGLFQFYTLPEHVDQRFEVFLTHLKDHDLWIASSSEVAEWWMKRDRIEMDIRGETAEVSNKGTQAVEGLAIKTGKGIIELPRIEPGQTMDVKV